MANIASQKKRILRTERERVENRRLTSAVRTKFRKFEDAASVGESDRLADMHRDLVSQIDKAVSKGAMHANTGARKKQRASRLLPSS